MITGQARDDQAIAAAFQLSKAQRADYAAFLFATREVCVRGEAVEPTPTEHALLEELARHAGTVTPHGLLREQIWGPECTRDAHHLQVFAGRLRQKLGDDAEHPQHIQTRWGTGYRPVALPLTYVDSL